MILTRKFLSILLITLTLCGVQVLQASPLHDHPGHLSGCTLCHFDGANAIKADSAVHLWVPEAQTELITSVVAAPTIRHYPAFRERAPPHHSS